MPSKLKHEFSFPPPGWPSNTVPASRKPITTSTQPYPGVPPPLPLNIHMVHPQSQLPPHPTNYIPHPGHQPHPGYQPNPQPPLGVHHTHPPPSHFAPPYPPANYHPINTHYHPPPQTAYQPVSAPSYRPSSYQSTPTRSSNTYSNSMTYSSRQTQNGNVPPPSRAPYTAQPQQAIYYHPQSYPPGLLPYFSAPPGQKTYDVTLSTPPTSQALYTTYPSRIRTGITSLVQPEHITGGSKEREAFYAEQERELLNAQRGGSGTSTPRYDSPLPGRGAGGLSTSRRGGRGRVNYAEDASDDDEDEDEEDEEDDEEEMEEPPSDPEDDNYGSRRRPGATRHSSSRRDVHSYGVGGGYGHDSQLMARANKAKRKREEMDRGWTWLGDRTPAERVRSSGARVTKHAYVTEELLEKEADRPELLVPITIDLDIPSHDPNTQGIRIKDRFLWNINEPFIEPIQFAQTFCDDLLIPHTYAATISELIKNQLEESQNTVEIDISNEDVTEEDVVWSEDDASEDGDGEMQVNGGAGTPLNGDVQVNGNGEHKVNGNGATEKEEESGGVEVEEEEQVEEKEKVWEEADCRITVNLDVQIYTHILRDRIEWDLSSTLPPLLFAKQYCRELGLTGEAIPQITWAIHEELLKHKKDALELELFLRTHPEEQLKYDKSGINPRTNLSTLSRRMGGGSGNGGKGLVGVWRDWFEREEYQPVLFELSFDEIIQREQERLRESRRVMRTLGGGGKRRRI